MKTFRSWILRILGRLAMTNDKFEPVPTGTVYEPMVPWIDNGLRRGIEIVQQRQSNDASTVICTEKAMIVSKLARVWSAMAKVLVAAWMACSEATRITAAFVPLQIRRTSNLPHFQKPGSAAAFAVASDQSAESPAVQFVPDTFF